jgi:hypothetical protein
MGRDVRTSETSYTADGLSKASAGGFADPRRDQPGGFPGKAAAHDRRFPLPRAGAKQMENRLARKRLKMNNTPVNNIGAVR